MNGFLFGCALAVFIGIKFFGKYLFEDPCEGSGNFREPVQYTCEDEDRSEKSNVEDEIETINKKLDQFLRK